MASTKQIIFNLGASSVTAAEFLTQVDGVTLQRRATKNLEYDYTQEERWIPAVLAAVKSMGKESGFSGKASLILPGFLLLTKIFRIAHVDQGKRMQMIAYEAQQNMPYPLSEVVWTHEVLSDDGIETEILFIAVKRDIINRLCSEMSQVGVEATSVGAATVLDYNAYRYAFGKSGEDALIVNIGARASNLTFVSEEGFFVRNISYGGNSLTQGVADATGSDFLRAENEKVRFFETGESASEALSSAVIKRSEDFRRKIGQEVTRSIVSYRQQRKAAAPKRIILAGRGSLIPDLAPFLEKAQKATVEPFDLAGHVELGPDVALGSDRIALTELFGLAVGKMDPDSFVDIDLLPVELKKQAEFKKKLPFLAVAAIGIAASPFPLAFAKSAVVDAQENRLAELRATESQLRGEYEEIEDLVKLVKSKEETIARFTLLQESRYNWIELFAELQRALVDARDVWLDELKMIREQPREQAGAAASPATFMLSLKGRMLVRDERSEMVLGPADINASQELLTRRIQTLAEQVGLVPFVETRISFSIGFGTLIEGIPLLPFELVYRINPGVEL
ncbi:MAG: pilus assembly protein PilM [Puniceicoccaceae bacterium]